MTKQFIVDVLKILELDINSMVDNSNQASSVDDIFHHKNFQTHIKLEQKEEPEEEPIEDNESTGDYKPDDQNEESTDEFDEDESDTTEENSNDPFANQEEIKDPRELGRVIELKKIYARLTSIETILMNSTDIILLNIKKKVSNVIELFEILTMNIETYKDDIDEIIVKFYKFIAKVYQIMLNYYKQEKLKQEKNKKK
jgi:hypothetical protein